MTLIIHNKNKLDFFTKDFKKRNELTNNLKVRISKKRLISGSDDDDEDDVIKIMQLKG